MAHGIVSIGVGSGEQGGRGIFKYGTNIVDRGLKVLFFGLFSVAPPEKISADALVSVVVI